MKLPDERFLATGISLGLALALSACGGEGVKLVSAPPEPVQGPAADYPVVLGAPFTVDGVLYTPTDTLNYDEVGYAAADPAGGNAVSGESRTLPLPSYVEVTSLESGQTILVRLERRGPMTGGSLIGLSAGAMDQLGAKAGTPVRVRRVNPPEQERAMLRRGDRAPERMETPMSLVSVLRRKLPTYDEAGVALASQAKSGETKDNSVGQAVPPLAALNVPDVQEKPAAALPPENKQSVPVAATPTGNFVVQAGAFSVEANARKVASQIDGTVDLSGKYYRVRTGPFVSRKQAQASLAKLKDAGYTGARIYSIQ